ncbi:MAG: glycosyltransferase [Ignavibacteriales bacterium]|nr:glycosyltransferase [Ignavibacteriales bacterium]
MKIVHIISSFSPGGAEVLVKDIAINTGNNYDVEVWAVGSTGDKIFEEKYKKELEENGVGFVNVGKVVHKNKFWVVIKLRQLIKERKPDVINSHTELATFYCTPAIIGLNVKLLQTIHNTVIGFPLLQKYFSRPFIKKYIAISEKCKVLIKDVLKVDEERIELIFNGINIRKYQQKQRVINDEVKNIICVGRLDVQKDHATLLKAFSILRVKLLVEDKLVPKLNLVGIGVLEDDLKKLSSKLGLNEDVIFWGARNDVPELLFQNDIWVMSSRWEGLSIALLEAFSSGIPVVATDVGSNGEVIEDKFSGRLVEKENPQALANTLYKLITNPEERKLYSKNAQKRAQEFKIESCVNNYLRLYNSLFELKSNLLSLSSSKA